MFYVSYIDEYPIYEPAEGGYYYAGEDVTMCRSFDSFRKANRFYQRLKKEFVKDFQDTHIRGEGEIFSYETGGSGSYTAFESVYIGSGARIQITRKRPEPKGWQPYC